MEKNKLEEEILASFERDEWQSVPNAKKEITRYTGYARTALAKDRRVNVRLSSRDLEALQARAAEEGMPYQTLLSSVLHKYVTGRLEDTTKQQKTSTRKRTG